MRCPVGLKLNNLHEVARVNENEPGDKQGRYFLKTSDGKTILRDVMRRHIPADIADATKQGFSAPDASWFKGESIEYVRRVLLQGRPRLYELLDRGTAQGLVEEHLRGEQNRRLFIWSLLNVEHWLAAYDA
jgi:asparagine synthase (glutamine-hydrolysing)